MIPESVDRIPSAVDVEGNARATASHFLGLDEAADTATVIHAIEEGFDTSAVVRLAEYLGSPIGDLLDAIDVARSTFARRKRHDLRLTRDESDRLYRLTRLVARAHEVLHGDAETRRWMNTPRRIFRDATPLAMSRTDAGAREVEDLLGRIEYGIPS